MRTILGILVIFVISYLDPEWINYETVTRGLKVGLFLCFVQDLLELVRGR